MSYLLSNYKSKNSEAENQEESNEDMTWLIFVCFEYILLLCWLYSMSTPVLPSRMKNLIPHHPAIPHPARKKIPCPHLSRSVIKISSREIPSRIPRDPVPVPHPANWLDFFFLSCLTINVMATSLPNDDIIACVCKLLTHDITFCNLFQIIVI